MGLYELNKKLTIARERGFILNQIKKFKIRVYSILSHVKIHYYLKIQIPMSHRLFSRKLSQNRDYIQTHCNGR